MVNNSGEVREKLKGTKLKISMQALDHLISIIG